MIFKHSGNAGDIIWSLPTVKAMGGGTFLINVDTPANYYCGPHPLKDIQISTAWANQLIPLLKAQPYIKDARIYNNETVDVDLDGFRKTGFNYGAGHIGRYYCHAFTTDPDFSKRWLTVKQSQETKHLFLVNRTQRYHNFNINYNFLYDLENVAFVGLEEEYWELAKTMHGKLKYHGQAKDFYQLASWIAGCKGFIGNQSLCMAIAEAVKKKPRILEVAPVAPNVILTGEKAYDIWTQTQADTLFHKVYNQK